MPRDRVQDLRELVASVAADNRDLLYRLQTPCLVAEGETIDENCRVASETALRLGVRIRPHAKAHKCSALLRRQLSLPGVEGVTCATALEAQTLAGLGFDDILIANEVIARGSRDALVAVAQTGAELTVAVDSRQGVGVIARVAESTRREVGVVVDINVGGGRCGVAPASDELWELAELAFATDGIRLEGIMGYTGQGNYLASRHERLRVAADVKSRLDLAASALRRRGLPVKTITGGSTGLFDCDQGLTEAQLGSYVLMEGRYGSVGLPFVPALFCAATVISRPRSDHAILDCGWKALSPEFGFPILPPGLDPVAFSDEHLRCRVTGTPPQVGDVLLVIPAHLDPTMNLHDRMVLFEAGRTLELTIDLRRRGSVLREEAIDPEPAIYRFDH
jgi:D-serine deaminase-like pyridoxal phosphate-dependent protein